MTRTSGFWVRRRTAPFIQDLYPDVYASSLEGMAIMRRDTDSAIVSSLEGMGIMRRDSDSAIVSSLEAMTILKRGNYVFLPATNNLAGTGSRSASTNWDALSNGQVWHTNANNQNIFQYTWLLSGSASDFEIRATTLVDTTSPSLRIGTFGSWLNLGSNRVFSWGIGSRNVAAEARVRMDIRDVATQTIQATCTVISSLVTSGGNR